MIFISTITKRQYKKPGKKMTWRENYNYHLDKYKRSGNACSSLYHQLCMNRADQQMHGVKSEALDLRKCKTKELYVEAKRTYDVVDMIHKRENV